MNARVWLKKFIILLCGALLLTALMTAWLDPFFHYHLPLSSFSYVLKNERAQNDGIVKRFSYDALITGTSMTQNFKKSEADALFACNAVKVCFSGGTYKEFADLLDIALRTHDVRLVVRDAYDVSGSAIQDKDFIPLHFEYPEYLYNDDPFDDVQYLLNRDVLSEYCLPMLFKRLTGREGGITDFDTYSAWSGVNYTYGDLPAGALSSVTDEIAQQTLTTREKDMIRENLEQNVLRLADEHPDTVFYYFIPPYSCVFWENLYAEGKAGKQIEAEAYTIDLYLSRKNIRLFSFSTDRDITFDHANYKDTTHYGSWINSMILRAMAEDDAGYRITRENADAYIRAMEELYLTPDHFRF